VESRRGVVGDLLGTLEGKDAQLVLSYIVWPGECPDPRFVDECVRREIAAQRYLVTQANTRNATTSVPTTTTNVAPKTPSSNVANTHRYPRGAGPDLLARASYTVLTGPLG
jgi:hypothetical protein